MKIYITACAWCDRIEVMKGQWKTMPDTLRAATLAKQVSHGICPDCDTKQRADLEELKRKKNHGAQ